MRRTLFLAVIALALTAPAAADTLGILYGNTLTLTDAQGGVTTVQLAEGGKFEQTNARGMWAAEVTRINFSLPIILAIISASSAVFRESLSNLIS